MDYLKVWTSFRETISTLNDAEKGRLFDAMLLYAETGEEPPEFQGNERFLWIVAKQDIDRTAQKCEALKANASKGGIAKSRNKQLIADDSKSCQTLANDSKGKQAEANPAHNIKKNNIKKNKENILFDRFWIAYPRHDSKATAQKAFEKLNPDEELLTAMLTAIEQFKGTAQWQENGGQFIPYAATWLNQKRWQDEVKAGQPTRTVTAQAYSQRDYSGEQEDAMKRMLEMEGA